MSVLERKVNESFQQLGRMRMLLGVREDYQKKLVNFCHTLGNERGRLMANPHGAVNKSAPAMARIPPARANVSHFMTAFASGLPSHHTAMYFPSHTTVHSLEDMAHKLVITGGLPVLPVNNEVVTGRRNCKVKYKLLIASVSGMNSMCGGMHITFRLIDQGDSRERSFSLWPEARGRLNSGYRVLRAGSGSMVPPGYVYISCYEMPEVLAATIAEAVYDELVKNLRLRGGDPMKHVSLQKITSSDYLISTEVHECPIGYGTRQHGEQVAALPCPKGRLRREVLDHQATRRSRQDACINLTASTDTAGILIPSLTHLSIRRDNTTSTKQSTIRKWVDTVFIPNISSLYAHGDAACSRNGGYTNHGYCNHRFIITDNMVLDMSRVRTGDFIEYLAVPKNIERINKRLEKISTLGGQVLQIGFVKWPQANNPNERLHYITGGVLAVWASYESNPLSGEMIAVSGRATPRAPMRLISRTPQTGLPEDVMRKRFAPLVLGDVVVPTPVSVLDTRGTGAYDMSGLVYLRETRCYDFYDEDEEEEYDEDEEYEGEY